MSTMTEQQTDALLGVYRPAGPVFVGGEGSHLIAEDGSRFLDFTAGIAVNALGYGDADFSAAVRQALETGLVHTSNLFRTRPAAELASWLTAHSFADRVFFCNSGAEANEGAIKMARRYHWAKGQPERFRILTFEGAFHGRTIATIAAGGQKKYLEGFGPKAEGFDQVPFGDHEAMRAAITPETAAILIEPIQGEGGIREVPHQCLRGLRELCDETGMLLIFDEVQTGVGRTGKLFAHEWAGISPDIMTVAKGIGGGFPMGAILATEKAGSGLAAGTHGTTFGGNPLAMAVGNAVLDIVLAPGFLDHVRQVGLLMMQRLAELRDRHPDVIGEVRGQGLLLGLRTVVPNGDFVAAARGQKLLTIPAGDNVVRLMPPLIITEAEAGEATSRLDAACTAVEDAMKAKGAAQ
jgi:acetylornithine/N-succinyldiaminopimelate aminotransferase